MVNFSHEFDGFSAIRHAVAKRRGNVDYNRALTLHALLLPPLSSAAVKAAIMAALPQAYLNKQRAAHRIREIVVTYTSNPNFSHEQPDKIGILITNLGTPAAPTAKALRPYLKQFLSDPRVVEFPRLLWWMILNGIILNLRPKKSAKSYASVWTDQGSPLEVYTKQQARALQAAFAEDNIIVDWAMRYGNPSIADTVQSLQNRGVRKLLILPLYPQYSGATTASTFDDLASTLTRTRWIPELRFITSYHDHPRYIDAITQSIRDHWQHHGKAQKLLFSYHGIPLRYLHQGDPYHCQCLKTSRLVAEKLQLNSNEYSSSFQSRFGREEWLKPYTDHMLKNLPSEGVKSVDVICPGFSSDCLETIEEIDTENRETFLNAGGERFHYIPALNASTNHISALKALIQNHLQGWQPTDTEKQTERQTRAASCPHNQQKR